MEKKKAVRSLAQLSEPPVAANAVGLRYVADTEPGFGRAVKGKKAVFVNGDGKVVRDPEVLRRLQALVIPPAWKQVWICRSPNGHLQATGRDARGRKQHIYHPRWREVRDEHKFNRMILFAHVLPKIRRRVTKDLRQQGLTRPKVLAAVTKLLEVSLIRVGNEEYARANRSFGLTTMQDWHVDISKSHLRFRFRGKRGIEHDVDISDSRLARIVRDCQEIPGQDLFQYLDDEGQRQTVSSGDVNEYLRTITSNDFSAKDFRTWAGTVLAAVALREFEKFDSAAQAKKNVVRAIESVAKRLGNTPTICRKCYIHPAVIDSYLDGSMLETVTRKAEEQLKRSLRNMTTEEAAVLGLLQQRLKTVRAGKLLSHQLKASLRKQSKASSPKSS